MPSALLALLLCAAPPVTEAESLAAKNDAEILFLKFGSASASDYSEPERERLAKALLKAARSARQDRVIALGLAERSVALAKDADGLALLAELETSLDQRSAAARHYDEALELSPKHVAALLGRAELAMEERDFGLATSLFERARSLGAKGAAARLAQAKAEQQKLEREQSELAQADQRIKEKVAVAARSATRDWIRQVDKQDEERAAKSRMAPDGVRQTSMDHFVYSYSAGERASGEMVALEIKIERLLDKVYDFASDLLGHQLSKKVAVSLLNRGEYLARYADSPMGRAAGFWDGRQIVINGGAELDEHFAEVMVHELTHAMVSDISGNGNRVPRWLNEGLAENVRLNAVGQKGALSARERGVLVGLAKAEKLPKLNQLEPMFASMSQDVHLAYLLSGEAVRLLVERKSYSAMRELLRELGMGKSPALALERHFQREEDLQSELEDELR